jgi:hypothetical protein
MRSVFESASQRFVPSQVRPRGCVPGAEKELITSPVAASDGTDPSRKQPSARKAPTRVRLNDEEMQILFFMIRNAAARSHRI